MYIRAYMRASSASQDADRARAQLQTWADERGLKIVAWHIEIESGTKLARPELFRLLQDAHDGDVCLVEQVDRLARLSEADWRKLRCEIEAKGVRIVALDLPTSWSMATTNDEFTSRMLSAVNGMLLDMLAAVARKDYEDRRRRQAQGQERAKAEGKYCGRPENVRRNEGIAAMLSKGLSWSQIQNTCGCSRATVAKIAARTRGAVPA